MRYTLAAALASMALLAGCGGDDKESDKPAADGAAAQDPKPPEPKEPLAAVAKKLETIADADCKEAAGILLHTSVRKLGTKPGAPPIAEECKSLGQFQGLFEGFKVKKTYDFGPAGVVQGTGKATEGDHLPTAMLVQDRDGRFRAGWGGLYDPQDRKPLPTSDFAGAAQKWTAAGAKGECDTVFRYFLGDARVVAAVKNDKAAFCKNLAEAYDRENSTLGDIAGDQEAHKPQELGKTFDIAFYGLPLSSGRYVVLMLTTKSEDIDPKLQKGHDEHVGVLEYPTVVNPND